MTDATMQKWWRKAVLACHGNTCVVCGLRRGHGELECHHIIKRRYLAARNDFRNGVPVCPGACHQFADKNEKYLLENSEFKEILLSLKRYTSHKELLFFREITREEWDKETLETLKRVAGDGEWCP